MPKTFFLAYGSVLKSGLRLWRLELRAAGVGFFYQGVEHLWEGQTGGFAGHGEQGVGRHARGHVQRGVFPAH